ncbi:MAG: response regulator transcription factor [Taibaiella sp.]|nr:response regulator transcription factor [Taibaiella sp.]
MANILIADDHSMFLQGLKLMLTSDQHQIIGTAANGEELIRILRPDQTDIIILDINMPVLNGYETTIRIMKEYPDMRIIALSMLADATSVSRMLDAGVLGYLFKNANEEELLQCIDAVMLYDYYVTEEMYPVLVEYQKKKKDLEKGYGKTEYHTLSKREIEIVRLIVEGLTNQDIAERLYLSVRTVDTHRNNILTKLQLKNTAMLVKYAMEKGAFLGL